MNIMLKQRIILLIIVSLLVACGFKLRGQVAPLPFKSLYITAPEGQIIGTELERVIRASSSTKLAPSMEEAEATLESVRRARVAAWPRSAYRSAPAVRLGIQARAAGPIPGRTAGTRGEGIGGRAEVSDSA